MTDIIKNNLFIQELEKNSLSTCFDKESGIFSAITIECGKVDQNVGKIFENTRSDNPLDPFFRQYQETLSFYCTENWSKKVFMDSPCRSLYRRSTCGYWLRVPMKSAGYHRCSHSVFSFDGIFELGLKKSDFLRYARALDRCEISLDVVYSKSSRKDRLYDLTFKIWVGEHREYSTAKEALEAIFEHSESLPDRVGKCKSDTPWVTIWKKIVNAFAADALFQKDHSKQLVYEAYAPELKGWALIDRHVDDFSLKDSNKRIEKGKADFQQWVNTIQDRRKEKTRDTFAQLVLR